MEGNRIQAIHWIDPTERKEKYPERKMCPGHRDPTANAAIGNIIREEKRNRRERQKAGQRQEDRRRGRGCDGKKQ